MNFFEYLTELNDISIILRLFLAVLFGGVIGLERGKRKQAAGFRTHVLVCLGSALVAVTNIYVVSKYGGDATRISAQVVSGIGFLGVGTIIVTGNKQIKGLTTAAGLWASACMGLAIGAGFYVPAAVSCVLIICAMTFLNKVEKHFYQNAKVIDLYIEFEDIKYLSLFIIHARESNVKTSNVDITKSKIMGESAISVLVTLYLPSRQDHAEVLSMLSQREGVNAIEEM